MVVSCGLRVNPFPAIDDKFHLLSHLFMYSVVAFIANNKNSNSDCSLGSSLIRDHSV